VVDRTAEAVFLLDQPVLQLVLDRGETGGDPASVAFDVVAILAFITSVALPWLLRRRTG